jgi:hypothetical protein
MRTFCPATALLFRNNAILSRHIFSNDSDLPKKHELFYCFFEKRRVFEMHFSFLRIFLLYIYFLLRSAAENEKRLQAARISLAAASVASGSGLIRYTVYYVCLLFIGLYILQLDSIGIDAIAPAG